MSKKNKLKYPREIIHSITSKDIKIESLMFDIKRWHVTPLDKDGNPVNDYGSTLTEYYRDNNSDKHYTSTWFNTEGEYGPDFAFEKYDSVYVSIPAFMSPQSGHKETAVPDMRKP